MQMSTEKTDLKLFIDRKEINRMTTQTTWSSPKHMVDWFNQLDDPDAFFKENHYRRFLFIQDSISLRSDSLQITFTYNQGDDSILGYASISVEMYLDDRDVESAEMTFNLKLPIDLKPEKIFDYINSKIIAVNYCGKEVVPSFALETEYSDESCIR